MARELTLSAFLRFSKNGADFQATIAGSATSGVVDVTGDNAIKETQTVTTGGTTLDKGAISTIGYVFMKNLSATNNVEFGPSNVSHPLMLKPEESSMFRWNSTNIHVSASSGTAEIESTLIED